MRTNTQTENFDKNTENISEKQFLKKWNYLPFLLLVTMIGAVLFLDAVLPLNGLWFHTALLSQLGSWPLLPTHILFPGWVVSTVITSAKPKPPPVSLSWIQAPILLLAFLLISILYLVALRRLPRYLTTCRYILYSTLLLGFIYTLIPVVTSPDLFSYMSYARMGVLYHLNPLTTLPTAIRSDPTFVHVYWTTQPSAYGPTWAAISSLLQELVLPFGAQSLLPMLMALRLFGLAMHLGSTLLIWSIIGHLQRQQEQINIQKRIMATLAFAWNPLLLLEACVNAHNDAALLLFILLAIWFLASKEQPAMRSYIMAIVMLALATCLKLNTVLLIPFVLIFVWKQVKELSHRVLQEGLGKLQGRDKPQLKQGDTALRHREGRDMSQGRGISQGRDKPYPYYGRHNVGLVPTLWLALGGLALLYAAIIILLYAPFWQHGAILNIFHTNPTTYRNINTPMEFLFRLYNAARIILGFPRPPVDGSRAEELTHNLSIGLFVVFYAWLCWRAIRTSQALRTVPSLVRWLALAWLLYCAVGTPWFWPWYLVTFFGLYAIVEATSHEKISLFGLTLSPLALSLLTFSMLSIYCFFAWGVYGSFVRGLPDFRWGYLRGLWAWSIPLLAIRKLPHPTIGQRGQVLPKETADQK